MRLGDMLIDKGLITKDQLRIAMMEQKKQDMPLGKILVKIGFLTEQELRNALGDQLGHDSIDLAKHPIDKEALKLIPRDHARRYRILPISYDISQQLLTVAMSDALNLIALDQTIALVGDETEIKVLIASDSEIANAIDRFYGHGISLDSILNEIETGTADFSRARGESNEPSLPLIRLVDAILTDAVKRGSSDIHFEPEERFLRIRFRIDGVLQTVQTIHKNYWSAIAVRLKVMSKMDIAETRTPQDGRISLSINDRMVDFRVASQPTLHGENFVLRVLDREKSIVPLDKLGLPEDNLALLKLIMARPEGIILVTGPTGSGKTTTLYSMLGWVNDETVNIMTLEDPVEYPMNLIRQSSVNEAAKMDFANGVRSMMRQDPDVILIGEIRDEETAIMAFRAAMTGHQVFATLHTNSAFGAIPRLVDIGVSTDILTGNIIGVVAQRLVRRLCSCKKAVEASEIERMLLGIKHNDPVTVYHPVGCERCDQRGYKGRIALIEILKVDKKLDEMIAHKASVLEMYDVAIARGFRPMADDGCRYVLQGQTSLEEISRVVDLTDRIPQ